MTESGEVGDTRRADAISRVEVERRDINGSEVGLSLSRLVDLVLGEGNWGGIVDWTEFALEEKPMITTDELVDGVLSLHDWLYTNT